MSENLDIGFKPLDKYHEHNDFVINKEMWKERALHGGHYGINRAYYLCKKCNVAFFTAGPYINVHFKQYGLNWIIQRPIKGLMPACPDCRKRDEVTRAKREKVRKDEKEL